MLNTSLGMISFAAPWLAWGAVAAVGLPLLAHLLSKTKYREVVFPAARLVQQAVATTSRIETPRHRLLMLLRWLILALLVLAFMRPQWVPAAQATNTERGIALIILIDASTSMQRTDGGASLYDRAQREARRLLDQLDPARDVAAIVCVDHAPTALLPEATAQFGRLAERLDLSEPGYTHANWPSAIAAAQRLARDKNRAVRIITLSDQQGAPPDASAILYEHPTLQIDHTRLTGPTDNAAVRLVAVRPYPAIAGQPPTASIDVQHFGDQSQSASLTASYQGNHSKQAVTITPGASQRIELRLPPAIDSDGLLQITLDSPDAIESDNTTGTWLPVQTQTRVLIVHDPDSNSTRLAGRLATVLNPGDVEGITLPSVETIAISQARHAITSAEPTELRTVVLLNRTMLSDLASQAIETYAQAGGGVIQFVADASVTPSQKTVAAGINFTLEPLRIFEGPSRAALASLPWPGVGNAAIDPRATPILMDALERVIVAQMQRGRGRLIAINVALGNEPGGLLAEPAFVVLLNELCRYASPGPALLAPPRPGDLIPPSLRSTGRITMPEDADTASAIFTVPGPYAALDSNGEIKSLIVAELDSDESDTRTPSDWTSADDATAGGSAPVDASNIATATTLRDKPIELWPTLVLIVLALVACESLLLWRFAAPRSPAVQGGAA